MSTELKLWELDNPSDPYTFYAPTVEIAGVVASTLSTGFGAHQPNDSKAERTPILFGWNEWFESRGISDLGTFIEENYLVLADAFDSFLIGKADRREDVESMLEMLPDDKRQQWKEERQDRNRTSVNQIGEAAYSYAKRLREHAGGQL